jgi:hypothetical protein
MSNVNESDWCLYCETQFNGEAENAFEATSMHLSFIDYYKPVFQLTGGRSQDSSVFFQGSDIGLLKALNSFLLRKLERFPALNSITQRG